MLFFFPRGVLDEILNLIESVSEGFPSYFFRGIFISGTALLNKCEQFDAPTHSGLQIKRH